MSKKKKNNRVLAIGMDSADPEVVEAYMDRGYMPNLSRLRNHGAYGRLENFDVFSAETPWTTFATGCHPGSIGYWSPLRLAKGRYAMETRAAYEFDEVPPFYALGDDYRVGVFDVPQVRVVPNVNGIQVGAWGAHSPQVPSASEPPSLFGELIDKHGAHPGLHDDYAESLNLAEVERLRQILPVGIRRRGDICVDLLKREPWDLFMTVFGEAHSVGHTMWHVSWPDHPLYKDMKGRIQGDPMREMYEAMDHSLGRMVDAAGPDMQTLVFSAHGMGPNTMDLPSVAFLPEFLFRYSFPGQKALAGDDNGSPLGPPLLKCFRDSWIWHVWTSRHDPQKFRKLLWKFAPWGALKYFDKYLAPKGQTELDSPFELAERGMQEVPVQPATWFAPFWPTMKAFALPSFSEGYVRLNVKGREAHGIVAPEDYKAERDRIVAALHELKDARSGEPMVRKIVLTREDGLDDDPKKPDADIVIGWQEKFATDVVSSPLVGRIGPLPHFRAGSHRHKGWVLASGPGIAPGQDIPKGHALDLAPTILSMLGAPLPKYLEGTPLAIPLEGQRAPLKSADGPKAG